MELQALPAEAQAQLAALAHDLGLPTLALDAQGVCTLAVGDELHVHLQADHKIGQWILFAVAGTLPPDPPAAFLIELLRANRFWHETGGATLSLDDQQPPRAVLARRVVWRAATPAEFAEAVDYFIDHVQEWHERLSQSHTFVHAPPRMSYA